MSDILLYCSSAAVVLIIPVVYYVFCYRSERDVRPLSMRGSRWYGSRFFVLCNPISGKREGKRIVETVVQPWSKANNITLDVVYTEKQLHAHEIAAKSNLALYEGILIVSGDGLVHEFMNGLASGYSRTSEYLKRLKMIPPIGIIPSGTCRGIAMSLHSADPQVAMEKIMRGSPKGVDMYHVTSVDTRESNIDIWDVHYFSWAIFADASFMIEKKIRWIPRMLRETVAAICVIGRRQVYRGTLYMDPVPMTSCQRKRRMYDDSNALTTVKTGPYKGQKVISGSFVMFTAGSMPYATYDMKLLPSSLPNDGSIDVILMRGTATRLQLLSVFLSLGDGSHVLSESVEVYKVKSFTLLPESGNLDVSGELYPCAKVHVCAHKDCAKFIY